jgi:hypothetical protein
VSRTFVSGFSNDMPFQRSTITFEDDPMPSENRPPERSCSAAACVARIAGPRA